MQAKTERFEMRLDQDTLDKVDSWRSRQDDLPSRAEAVRRLVEAGLAGDASHEIKFSDGEKLITSMLCELYKHLKLKGEIDPEFVESAIHGGHYWGLEWQYSGLFHGHEDKRGVLKEVVAVLDMWSFLENAYAKLAKKEKERIEKEAEPFGKDVKFAGFDGNNESSHMSIARFLIEELERFTNFKGRYLNAHMPTIDTYRRMLKVFEPMRATLHGGYLSASQIIDVMKARTHPDYRKESATKM